MTPNLFRALVADACLSPNVHNIQPTRWRLVDDATIALIAAPDRHLPVGDPTGRDAAASHGAAFEGMIIAASSHGIHRRPGSIRRGRATGHGGHLRALSPRPVPDHAAHLSRQVRHPP